MIIFMEKRLKANSISCLLFLLVFFLLNSFAISVEKNKDYYTSLSEKDPFQSLRLLTEWRDKPFAESVLENLARRNSSLVLEYSVYFNHKPYQDKIIKIAARMASHSDPDSALSYSNLFKGQPWAKEVIENAGQRRPFVFMSSLENFNDQPWAKEIIPEIVRIAPAALLFKYIQAHTDRDKFIKDTLANSSDTVIQIVLTLADDSGYTLEQKSWMLSLIHNMVYHNLTLNEAGDLVQGDPLIFLRTLIAIHNEPNMIGKDSVEHTLNDLCVRWVDIVNDLHESSSQIRFASVDNFSPAELYNLMVYSEKEIYTSSFNGIFDRFITGMKKEHKTGEQQLQEVRFNKYKTFIKQMAYYNRLNEFLGTMNETAQKQLLQSFVKNLDKDKDFLEQAATVADTFGILQEYPGISKVLRDALNQEYKRISQSPDNRQGNLIYGILVQMFGKGNPINNQWIEKIAGQYNIPDPLGIPAEKLFPAGVNIQRYYFYDDKDGHASFQSFLHEYKNSSDWNVEHSENYEYITSVGKDSAIEIYANNPDMEMEGNLAIDSIFLEKKIGPVIIVHRGHSYHVDKTIERIPYNARIVYLGSCGGYYEMGAILLRAPQAHIITTKGTGSAEINDPLLKLLNDDLYSQRNLYWPGFWELAEKKLGNIESFKDYIPPDKNLAVLFYKIYYKQFTSKSFSNTVL